ncbi:hypothetical protein COU59_00925 [Candidatus Pacearchaeota archaeon CG10_big_fil_rev_8_21_14_0_10_34_12]|nr:MAG: hypothetical protein COU59_00925 [Candidatus Pacearchaeota archaeon CG10_big_fil_rev_8_21_14_0_10_34_12]
MEKDGEKGLTSENLTFLVHATDSLEEAGKKLEEYYLKKDYGNFENVKKFMMNLQEKISEIVK